MFENGELHSSKSPCETVCLAENVRGFKQRWNSRVWWMWAAFNGLCRQDKWVRDRTFPLMLFTSCFDILWYSFLNTSAFPDKTSFDKKQKQHEGNCICFSDQMMYWYLWMQYCVTRSHDPINLWRECISSEPYVRFIFAFYVKTALIWIPTWCISYLICICKVGVA